MRRGGVIGDCHRPVSFLRPAQHSLADSAPFRRLIRGSGRRVHVRGVALGRPQRQLSSLVSLSIAATRHPRDHAAGRGVHVVGGTPTHQNRQRLAVHPRSL